LVLVLSELNLHYKTKTLPLVTALLTNFEVDQTGSAFMYNNSTDYKRSSKHYKLFKYRFFTIQNNINTEFDFNFRAGIKYFLPIKYKIDGGIRKGNRLLSDVNLTIDNLPEFGFVAIKLCCRWRI
jgi:hypothetical protein